MDKLKMETADLTQSNIEKLAALFPACITETCKDGKLKKAVNFELLRQMLSDEVLSGDEAYEFTWVGKKAAIIDAHKPTRQTLRPCPTESVNWDTTENLYIEGDNLEVLKLLQNSYLGKVKMIYIDPPYNTGNDFIYRNNFTQSRDEYREESGQIDENGDRLFKNTDSNGRFHSDWCSMIYSRLILARNLLSDDGVIILAIDDNEIENLIKICDEIFGAANKIGLVTVVHKPEGRNQEKFFGTSNEFALFYAKNKSCANFMDIIIDDEKLESYIFSDDNGKYKKKDFIRKADGKYAIRQAKPNFWYPIYVSRDLKDISITSKSGYHEVYPIINSGIERTWKTLPQTFIELYRKGEIVADNENGKIVIYEKMREKQVIKTHWIKKEYHAYHFGTKILDELLECKSFDFPKSLYLIIDLIKLTTSNDDIILDFFSGSATTAHAVMKLNAEDGGKRKFIMVQLPECKKDSEAYKAGYKNICEVGKERIRRAAKKIKEENPDAIFDGGFRVFKLADGNMTDVYYSAGEYNQGMLSELENNIKDGRTDLDLLFGSLLEWGLPLSMPHTSEQIGGGVYNPHL